MLTQIIKKCDLYKKLPTELAEPTTSGAVISIIAAIMMFLLFIGELKAYLNIEERTEIFVDTNPPNAQMRINLDIDFYKFPCHVLSVDQQDMVGTHTVDIAGEMRKFRLNEHKQNIGEYVSKSQDHNPHDHSSSLSHDEIVQAFENNEGCKIQGYIIINRVPGNFHVSCHAYGHATVAALRDIGRSNIDLTHKVNHLSFGEARTFSKVKKIFKGGEINPMDNQENLGYKNNQAIQTVYYLNVIPSYFTDSNGLIYELDQYTYSQSTDPAYHISSVYFKYAIEPTSVLFSQQKEGFIHFLVQICSFIGGVFIVAGFVDSIALTAIRKLKKNNQTLAR